MTPRAPVLGWLGAASTAAVLLTAATALAITATPPQPLMLDLGQALPAAPAVAAIAEAAPQVVDEAPTLDTPPELAAKDLPTVSRPEVPVPPSAAPPVSLPEPEVLTRSDLALPPPEPPQKPADSPPAPKKQARVEKPAKPPAAKPAKPVEKAAKPAASAASAGSSAPQKGQKAKGGAKVSAAAYAKAVMKKVRATKKRSGAGKGVAVVGFTVAANGGLAGVTVIRSSGNAALDQIALNHIQRAAPFPAPPEGAGRSFSFEFVGK